MEEGSGRKFESLAETAIIIAFFAAILFLGPASASEHRIKHDYPVGYGASDAFQHQTRAEAIKNMGQYKNEAPYMMAGLTVIGFYPPLLYHDTVLLSHLSGLKTYDALFLIVGMALALAAVATYYLARSLGKPVALLVLPLTLFIAGGKPFLGLVTFGQMPVAISSLFLVAAAWAITRLSLPMSYLLIAAFVSGSIMAHTSETLFLAMLMAATLGPIFLAKVVAAKDKLNGLKAFFRENRTILIGLALAVAFTSYFLPIFFGIWPKLHFYKFNVEVVSASFPAATFFPTDFGLMLWAIAIGALAAVMFAVQKRHELAKLLHSPKLFTLAFSLYMVLAGLGTYAGFGLRSFQTRLFWPITLAPLAGFGLYQLLRIILALLAQANKGTAKGISAFAAAAVTAAILGVVIFSAYYSEPSAGSMDKDHWEALKWVAENTPEDAEVYVLFSYAYSQTSVLYNTERVSYFLEFSEFVKLINSIVEKGNFDRTPLVSIAADGGAGFPYRKGLLSFGQQSKESPIRLDMCNADYYVIDTAFPQQAQTLGQANQYLQQRFLQGNMTVEYQNQWVSVLKNSNRGGDCIA